MADYSEIVNALINGSSGKGKFNKYDSMDTLYQDAVSNLVSSDPFIAAGSSLSNTKVGFLPDLNWKENLALTLMQSLGGGVLTGLGKSRVAPKVNDLSTLAFGGEGKKEKAKEYPDFAKKVEGINKRAEQEKIDEITEFANKEALKAKYGAPVKLYEGDSFKQVNPVTGEVVGYGKANTGTTINVGGELGLKDTIAAEGKLYDQVARSKVFQDYQQGNQHVESIRSMVNNDIPVTDYMLGVEVAKFIDPTSVAREGEVKAFEKAAQTLPQDLAGSFRKAFYNKGKLLPETRRQVLKAIEGIQSKRQQAAQKIVKRQQDRAARYNLDPLAVDPFGVGLEGGGLELGQDVGQFQQQQELQQQQLQQPELEQQQETTLNGVPYIKVKGGWVRK